MTKSVFSDRYRHLIKLIVEERQQIGLTQADLAGRLGKPQSYISKLERGERRLDVLEFYDIAIAIGFSPSELLYNAFEIRQHDEKIK